MLPGTGPDTPAVVVTVAGPDGCAFVHPARKAVTIRMHAQRRGKNDLFICFHRLLALSGAPEISCDDDKKPAEKQVTFPLGKELTDVFWRTYETL